MQQRRIIFGALFIFSIAGLAYIANACELDQTQHGCRIDNGQCTCAFGCKSEFRYATRKECQDALKVDSSAARLNFFKKLMIFLTQFFRAAPMTFAAGNPA
uniref:(northern house mosquito) hypothetical protein n=1 Tax=Culex pipiens TaxID=7175 RepID=A0A8D8CFC7_CULPI